MNFENPYFPTVQEIQEFAREVTKDGYPQDEWHNLSSEWAVNLWMRDKTPWITVYAQTDIEIFTQSGISMPFLPGD
jgi:hypothetical protein